MGKKVRFDASERAYGRIGLSELTHERTAEWSVRAVAGETRRFERPTAAASSAPPPTPTQPVIVNAVVTDASGSLSGIGLRCRTCEVSSFPSVREQHAHFKSEWHRVNLKRNARGAAILTESEFEERERQGDKDKHGSASSSGSESSSSSSDEAGDAEAITTTEPVVEYTDGRSIFKVFKTVLSSSEKEEFNPFSALEQLRTSRFRWAIFLLRSGRFAGAVFDREKAICHKTFQRYTTRRKQGGSQSANDNAGGRAKSAGATLRRYNEQQLKQDIVDLLVQWKEHLQSTELIFLACVKAERQVFFGGKTPVLTADDTRIRRVPFITSRPTFEEVCRVRSELASVKFAPLIASGAVNLNETDDAFMTALHHAAEQNEVALAQLLLESGANPSLLDLRNRPPYYLCTTKEMRNVFRRYMAGNPDAWDYSASQIPSGLTDEMEQKKKEKEAEKRRRARERKKQQKKDEAEQKRKEEEERAEQERKIAAGLACDFCGKFAGKSTFTRLEFKYCSTDCVNHHRRKLMGEAALKRLGG
ncbi:hypothetical protein ATCC90586_004690 [Pythium insidiosum]|nr:hypothetical protein ATCC90586_004690 [Pythium insidiosum]